MTLTLATPGPLLSGACSAEAGSVLVRVAPIRATPVIKLVSHVNVIAVFYVLVPIETEWTRQSIESRLASH
jgi:hypothetical protein